MKKKIFRLLFKKEMADLAKKEEAVKNHLRLKEMIARKRGNPLKIYRAFVDRSARCGIIMFIKTHSFEEKIKELEDRAIDLMSPERLEANDVMSTQTTFNHEIELLLIRIIIRYAKKYGEFPANNQYILERYEDLAKDRMDKLDYFLKNVIDKLDF